MKDYLYIDTTPSNEKCTQVNDPDYSAKARAEGRRMLAQIDKHYPLPENASMGYTRIKSESHDFGSYYQIQIIFDDECESSVNWAFSIEADSLGALEYWDEETKLDYCPPTSPEELNKRFALV